MKALKVLLNLFLSMASGLLPAVFAFGMWSITGELQFDIPQDVIPTVCGFLVKISPFAAFVFLKRRNWPALVTCGCAAAVAFGLRYFTWAPDAYPTLSHLVNAIAIMNTLAFFASMYHEGMGRGDEPRLQQLGCGKHGTLNQQAEDSGVTITIRDRLEQVHR